MLHYGNGIIQRHSNTKVPYLSINVYVHIHSTPSLEMFHRFKYQHPIFKDLKLVICCSGNRELAVTSLPNIGSV